MKRREVERIIESISRSLPSVGEAMRQWLDEFFGDRDEMNYFSFALPLGEMATEVYDWFRPTPWFIAAVPDRFFGEGMARGCIRAKQFVEPLPSICFHATPVSNKSSIESQGLLLGVVLGRTGRLRMFADSPYYIFASLTEPDAREWCLRFTEEEFLVYPVQIGKAGIRLFVDPCSVSGDGEVSGFIIDAVCVKPQFLDAPFRVNTA